MNGLALPHPMPVLPAASPDTLTRCLVLALLLHLALLVWVGNVDGGSAAPGRGVWGRSDAIELRLGERGGEAQVAPPAVPTAPEPPRGPVGSATQPRFGGVVREAEQAPPPEPRAEPGAAQLGHWAPIQPAANADRNLLPAATAPLATPSPLPAPTLPELVRVQPAPPPERALQAEPVLRSPAVATPAPAIERSAPLATPAPLPELSTPSLARPVPVPAPEPVPTPPAVPAQPPVPTPAAATTPAAVPDAPVPSPAAASPAAAAAPSIVSPQPGGVGRGAADAGSRIGPDAATPPSASASAPPPLNLALPKSRGGPLSAGSTPGVLSLLPRPPEKNKLASEIDKSGKTDCRSAYSGAGLLAVVPLAADALKKDGGCKW